MKLIQRAMVHHLKCRQKFYTQTQIQRFPVPDNMVPWSVIFENYDPPFFSQSDGKPWEDRDIRDPSFKPKWNAIDGDVNRQSLMGFYQFNDEGYPLNPIGRTGLAGRGVLGRWGPNHAADPIITRWKTNEIGEIKLDETTKKPILQFIAIQRRDNHEWAIPGGMVDGNETISSALKREFMEEVLNSLEKTPEQIEKLRNSISHLFARGDSIYEGYVDDPRNTDHAWMETRALNFHDQDNSTVGSLALEAGDDAADVRWMDIRKDLNLYASHAQFIELVIRKHHAHW